MFWYFAFAAVIVWLQLLYSALRKRIDSALEQLRQNIVVEVGALSQKPEPAAKEASGDDLDSRARKQIYKDFPRYGIHDDYTVSELLRAYEREDSRGRIRLLRRVYAQGVHLPYEVAFKAVTDSDSLVREWMAKEAPYLDYRETRYEGASEQFSTTYVHPERDLAERLRQDPDPFIRAALRENPKVSDWGFWGDRWVEEFRNCVPLERLAMMRNKKLDLELVNRILDVDDTELNLEKEERFQLARACLVNEHVVQNSRRSRTRDFVDGWASYQARKNAKTVWELAAKWPEDSGIQFFAFKNVQTDDEVKAHIYSECQSTHIRSAILDSCFPEDKETLALGRADADPTARYIAYGRSRSMERGEIEDALRREKDGTEKWLVGSLLENPWLGSIARELHKAMDDIHVQPISGTVSENNGQATQIPYPRRHRENANDLPTEDRVTELFQEWQQGGKEGLRKAYQKEEEK
jgi:hypothetical protein